MPTIDHLILPVNDVAASIAFYVEVLGFRSEGERLPFTVVRVSGVGGEPGVEDGAHGPAPTVYCNDPNRHLIEIRTYDA